MPKKSETKKSRGNKKKKDGRYAYLIGSPLEQVVGQHCFDSIVLPCWMKGKKDLEESHMKYVGEMLRIDTMYIFPF